MYACAGKLAVSPKMLALGLTVRIVHTWKTNTSVNSNKIEVRPISMTGIGMTIHFGKRFFPVSRDKLASIVT